MHKKKETQSIVQFHKTMALTLSDQLSAFKKNTTNF